MELVEEMIPALAREACGADRLSFKGREISLAPPWRRLPLLEAIMESTGEDLSHEKGGDAALEAAERLKLQIEGPRTYAKIVDEILKRKTDPYSAADRLLAERLKEV